MPKISSSTNESASGFLLLPWCPEQQALGQFSLFYLLPALSGQNANILHFKLKYTTKKVPVHKNTK